jgi:hypothetical protein
MLDHDLDPAVARSPEDRALDTALDCWRGFMDDTGGVAPAWYPGTAAGIRWRASTSFEDMARDADDSLGAAVDACVDSLPGDQREALHVHVLRTRWRGRPMEYAGTLQRARRALREMLVRRHAIVVG